MEHRIWTSAAIRGVALLVGPWLASGVQAEPTLLEQLRSEMTAMEVQISASVRKLRRPMAGLAGDSGETLTPALVCCPGHLEMLKQHAQGLDQAIDGLHEYYTSTGDHVGLDELAHISDLSRQLSLHTLTFEKAPHAELASGALQAMTRPYIDLRQSVERLVACCPIIVEPAVPPDDGKTRKKGKKKPKDSTGP